MFPYTLFNYLNVWWPILHGNSVYHMSEYAFNINPRRHSPFRHPRRHKGAVRPPGFSKLSVVELSGKDCQIALDEYSRLVVRFCS